jgi:membrane fusion protein, heavy metal efflux system
MTCRSAGFIALFVTQIAFLSGCGEHTSAADTKPANEAPVTSTPANTVVLKPDAPELREMKIEQVKTLPMAAEEITAPARIEVNPNRVGHAMLPTPGRIATVFVKLGDAVTAGQPLLSIRSATVAEAEAAYIESEAAVRQADLARAKADADLSRLSDLLEHQAVAQKDVLSAQTIAESAKASLEQARSAREHSIRRLSFLGLKAGKFDQSVTLTSPISGKVLELNVVAGEFRNEINTPLITIADLSRVWATSEVPESKIRHCKIGGTATLDLIAYPGEEFRARVTRIADTVNSETRTIKVTAELDNPAARLRPDMFGKLRYTSGTLDTPWVPDAAVFRMDEHDYVFVQEAKGRFRAVQVELGRKHEGGYAVLKGVSSGEPVVTQGSVYLKASL